MASFDGTKTSAESTSQEPTDDRNDAAANFECNICLDVASDAVISLCGHIFW